MAGSNYDVNIKLDVRKINQQISNLERRISKLNALAQGKKGDSKTLLKNERDKAALLLKQERTQKAIAEGCTQEDVKCTFYSLENKQMKTNHLDELGYNKLSDEIIKSYNLKK